MTHMNHIYYIELLLYKKKWGLITYSISLSKKIDKSEYFGQNPQEETCGLEPSQSTLY